MGTVIPCHVPQTVTSHVPLTLTCYSQIEVSASQNFCPTASQIKGRVVRIYGPKCADTCTWQGALRVINKVSEDEGTMLPRLQLSQHGIRFVINDDEVEELMGV